MSGRLAKGVILHTVEHREYRVKARNLQEAFKVVKEANLGPKSRRVYLIDMADFKVVEEEEM